MLKTNLILSTALIAVILASCDNSGSNTDQATDTASVQTQGTKPTENARQGPPGGGDMSARFAQREAAYLAEPFQGVSTSNGIEEGLFSIAETGISTAPVVNAADAFVSKFSADQQNTMTFEIDNDEWRKWSNVDNGIYSRQGISLKAMTTDQKAAAFNLMKTSLSAKGLTQSKDIMKTDQTLRELNDNAAQYDEELYFFTVMGTPSMTEPWGWQIDGHHLVINYFVLGDQIVMSPVFMGGEPVHTDSGNHAGNVILQPEQNVGLQFMQMLDSGQQAKAIISADKSHNDNQGEAMKDNITLDYEGLPVSEMTAVQRAKLLELAGLYIGNLRDEHARVTMEDIETHLNNTWFAWIGDTTDDAVFYYRIHSPVVLIEFDHQGPIGIPNAGDRKTATRNHIHTMVRTPNGNDYGKDLLRQHLEEKH